MNLLHMKYAVKVAETGTISKAAEKLYVGQPNLSRAIKELETSLGIVIFDRSVKGMFLTPDGEVFIRYAKSILKQVDEVEEIFGKGTLAKKQFSISVPKASYVTDAFAKFSKLLSHETDFEIFYQETNTVQAINNILKEDYKLGIIRYAKDHDKYYKSMMDEKGLYYEVITKFRYILLMNKESELAQKPQITYSDLKDRIEIAHADPFLPSLPFSAAKKEEFPDNIHRCIFVFERASQFELLMQNPDTFMWVSPIPESMLNRYGLIQRNCDENKRIYNDVLVRKKEYALSDLDSLFISELFKSRREIFKKDNPSL